MKPPEAESLQDAYDLARCIQVTLDRIAPWTVEFVWEAWDNGTFNSCVANDWEHVWTEQQCRRIMTLHIADRIAR